MLHNTYYFLLSDELYDIKPFGMLSFKNQLIQVSVSLVHCFTFEMQAAQQQETPDGSSSSHLQRGQACITCR